MLVWCVDRDAVSCLILLLSGEMSCLAGNEITKYSPSPPVSSRRQGRPESRLFISNLKLMFVRVLPQKKRLNVRFECFVWLLHRNMIKHPDTNGVWLIELQFFLRNKIIKQLLGKIYQKCSRNKRSCSSGRRLLLGWVFAGGRQDCLCRNYFDLLLCCVLTLSVCHSTQILWSREMFL